MKRAAAILFLCAVCPSLPAQTWRVLPGTGCQQLSWSPAPPALSGPLTIGSVVTLSSLGVCTPYYSWEHDTVGPTFVHFGVPQAPAAWIGLDLWIDSVRHRCLWAVQPLLATVRAPVDASFNYVPMQVPIPNEPGLVGATLAIQSSCWAWWEALSMSPGPMISRALEIAIG